MQDLDDIERTIYRFPGILGVYWSSPEVKAVYPTISSTVQPHKTDIEFRQGDAFDIGVLVQDDADNPQTVSIDGCMLRFAAKLGSGVVPGDIAATIGLDGAIIVKRSSDPSEIAFAGRGQARIIITMGDTIDHPLNMGYAWDLQITRPIEQRSTGGKFRISSDGDILFGHGTDLSSVTVGDILKAQGKMVIITELLDTNVIRVDCSTWTNETRADYEIWRSESRIVASGHWTCVGAATTSI